MGRESWLLCIATLASKTFGSGGRCFYCGLCASLKLCHFDKWSRATALACTPLVSSIYPLSRHSVSLRSELFHRQVHWLRYDCHLVTDMVVVACPLVSDLSARWKWQRRLWWFRQERPTQTRTRTQTLATSNHD